MISCVISFLAIVISSSYANAADETNTCACDEGWYEVPEHGCFLFNVNVMDWMTAQTFCKDNGGYLAEPIDVELQEALLLDFAIIYGRSGGIWIGGNDLGTEGEWRWIHSGTNITETFWHSGYPRNDTSYNCLIIDAGLDYEENWEDLTCDAHFNFICQKPTNK